MSRILIADDQPDVLEALRFLLKGEGYKITTVTSPDAVLKEIESNEFDVLLTDLNYTRDTTSGQEGLDLLTQIQMLDSTLPVVVMTAWGSVDVAVEAMRRGARDFIEKPWDNARLLSIIKTQIELSNSLRKGEKLEAENILLRDNANANQTKPVFVAESAAMRHVMEMVTRIAPSDANVLITGENGTGKEVVARMLHYLSSRSNKPMVIVNAGALSEGTFESELFGHVRGAFTDAKTDRVGRFELADNGTLFLDEVTTVPLNLQPKLLRVIETGEFERVGSSKTRKVNVRVISATNSDVREEVEQKHFRKDLFFRLNTVEIHLPPLRERGDDILLLADYFLNQHSRRYRREITGFDEDAKKILLNHTWLGNVRELDHTIERAVLMSPKQTISATDLGLQQNKISADLSLDKMSLEDVEKLLVKKALARFDGNANKAAEALGLSRSAFYRRLQKFGL